MVRDAEKERTVRDPAEGKEADAVGAAPATVRRMKHSDTSAERQRREGALGITLIQVDGLWAVCVDGGTATSAAAAPPVGAAAQKAVAGWLKRRATQERRDAAAAQVARARGNGHHKKPAPAAKAPDSAAAVAASNAPTRGKAADSAKTSATAHPLAPNALERKAARYVVARLVAGAATAAAARLGGARMRRQSLVPLPRQTI